MTTRTASSTTRSSSKAKTKGKAKTGFTTREAARLHPQTVSNYKQHARTTPKKGARSSRIATLRVDPRIWGTALELAQGNPRRIEVIDEVTVIVHNNPRGK